MKLRTSDVVVLGAGLQGSCIALELAGQGVDVVLLDRDPWPMNRASLRNEGKIHLGLIYANDRTKATGASQLDGSLRFHRLLRRWIGTRVHSISVSSPFLYLVANDSLLSPDVLAQHYDDLQTLYRTRLDEDPEADYLGERPETLAVRSEVDRFAQQIPPERVQAVFDTVERAVDPQALSEAIREAIAAHPHIQFLPSHTIVAVEPHDGIFRIHGVNPDGGFGIAAEQVVNATWENRMAIDRTAGLEQPAGWLHRLKYRIIARLPPSLHGARSTTMVLGRYGDVVIRPDGTAYLSWYPASLRGWTHDLQPPASWDGPCRGVTDPDVARELVPEILSAIDDWFPGIKAAEPLLVDAGAIVAHGSTDVDNPASGLHDRTRIGVSSHEGYHSVNPGKLTTAPVFAMEAAARVRNRHARVCAP